MPDSRYFTEVADRLRRSPVLARTGFDATSVEVWEKGADHQDLLQIKKPEWRVLATDGEPIGYRGIEVHYESCRPGHFVIHCELWPRQGKARRAATKSYSDLLELKGVLTSLLRERGAELGWDRALGAHLKRARSDPRDPSSLIVYTFELGLLDGHTAEEYVASVLPILESTAPVIDEVVIDNVPR